MQRLQRLKGCTLSQLRCAGVLHNIWAQGEWKLTHLKYIYPFGVISYRPFPQHTFHCELKVTCPACKGRGLVICRDCFSLYGENPSDIEAIREKMRRMPD